MKECDLVKALFYYTDKKDQKYMSSNTTCVPKVGECDFLSVSKAGLLTEYEIKTSRSDFKADFRNKPSKHKRMAGEPISVQKYNSEKSNENYRKGLQAVYDEYEELQDPFVNYFYFVCPEGLIKPEELPEYAGLIYAKWFTYGDQSHSGRWIVQEIKKPKRFHKNKPDDKFIITMLRSVMFKYYSNYVPTSAISR